MNPFTHTELCRFLVQAKKSTYATGDTARKIIESDHSTTLIFEESDWKYHDNYFGGEPYGGREVVFFQNQPVYIMVYYGWVDASVDNPNTVYSVLQNALSRIPLDTPFRGPSEYSQNGFVYQNTFSGSIDNFSGEEIILSPDDTVLYTAKYMGGLVDRR